MLRELAFIIISPRLQTRMQAYFYHEEPCGRLGESEPCPSPRESCGRMTASNSCPQCLHLISMSHVLTLASRRPHFGQASQVFRSPTSDSMDPSTKYKNACKHRVCNGARH